RPPGLPPWQFPAPRLPAPRLPAPRLPAPRLPAPRLPAPRLPAPRLPAPRLPAPRLPAPRLPAPRLPAPRLPPPRPPRQRASVPGGSAVAPPAPEESGTVHARGSTADLVPTAPDRRPAVAAEFPVAVDRGDDQRDRQRHGDGGNAAAGRDGPAREHVLGGRSDGSGLPSLVDRRLARGCLGGPPALPPADGEL